MGMSKEALEEVYLDRVEDHEFSFKIDLAVGTFEAYGHWSSDNEIDYDYFIDQVLQDGGRYKHELWKDAYDYEWDLLIFELLQGYYGAKELPVPPRAVIEDSIILNDNDKLEVEKARVFWSEVAKENGWYVEPFYVQVWIDKDGEVIDSLSHKDLPRDLIIKTKLLNSGDFE